jgi:CelD/BcsL family acetyltransferase involved in cellulose biosynthesis
VTAVALVSARSRLAAALASVDEVRPAWASAAADAAEHERPYVGPEWGDALAQAFVEQGRAHFIAFEEAGHVTGVAPLWFRRRFGVGLLTFLGSGPRDYSLADYQRVLAPAGREPEAIEAFVDWLEAEQLPWHVASFHPVASRDQAVLLEHEARDRGWHVRRRSGGMSYVIDLPATWDSYLESLPTNLRQQLPRQLRKLEREHNMAWERIDTLSELPAALEDLQRLHSARWRVRGEAGLLDGRVFLMVSQLSTALLSEGHLDLVRLRIDGAVRAAILNFRYGDTVLFYLSGFDPGREWSKYSLGNLIIAHSIQDAIESGARRFDLLRGDEAYKPRFGGRPQPTERIVIYRSPAAYVAYRLLAKLDRAMARIPSMRS